MKSCAFLLLLICFGANGAPLDEDFGYVDVRTGAHMFWVVYHTEVSANWTDAPLIMWLQGGPGASGVGYGNFKELGPYDIYGNLRPGRWTLKANVMFVDNPVGTGYSYVDDLALLTTTNQEIADDLLILIKSVFASYPEMQVMPFFVYAESYGGKMTVDFARVLVQAIANAEINCTFHGVALGDSWISPMDSVNTWGTYLYWMGFVNADGQARIDEQANRTQAAVDAGNWVLATYQWGLTESVVLLETDGVDFYNVLAENSSVYSLQELEMYTFVKPELRQSFLRHVLPMPREQRDELTDFMNGPQAQHWNISAGVVWGGQSGSVFTALEGDFMKPVIDSVSDLLTNASIHVSVYTGDLDLICDTPGTYRWIENMQYPQKPSFEATNRQSLKVTAYPNNAAYVQRFERFSLFTILRSGHMVPIDAPEMCLNMIDMITQYGAEAGGAVSKKLNHGKTLKNNVQKLHSKISAAKTSNKEEINAEKETHIKEMETKIEHAINHHKAEHVPKHASKKEHAEHVIKEHKKENGPIPVMNNEHTEHIIKEHNAEHVPKHVIKKEETKSAKEEVKPKNYEQIELSPRVSDLLKEKLHQNRNVHAKITKPANHEKQPEPAGHHPSNAHIRDIKAHAAMPAARNVFHNSQHRQN